MNILQRKKYQRRAMIEQSKVTCSSLGKAFEKHTKTIEEQGRKQAEAIEEHGKQLVKFNVYPEKEESIPLDKQKEILYYLVPGRTGGVEKLHT